MNTFTSLRLRYMEFPGRAQAIRDTLRMGRIDFVDEHLTYDQFRNCRAAGEFPFGGIPVLVIETSAGTQCVAQSNAILRFAGRLTGLYPVDDSLQALKVDEALGVGRGHQLFTGAQSSRAGFGTENGYAQGTGGRDFAILDGLFRTIACRERRYRLYRG